MASSSMKSSSSLMASSSMTSSKTVTLRSSDGEIFIVGVDVAMLSVTIKNMIDNNCANTVIPIINIDARILSKVLDYCKTHIQVSDKKEIDSYDSVFVRVDQPTLFQLILAANYLDIKTLMELTCRAAADVVKDMTVEQVRKYFNIRGDFTPEEEEKLREKDAWAYELKKEHYHP